MDKKICIDTDVCIAILKKDERIEGVRNIIENNEVCISVVTLFELLLRKTRLDIIDNFLRYVQKIPITEEEAREASNLFKELINKGNIIDFKDLFIASTCIVNNYYLLTFNKKHFDRLKEFGLLLA
ncbi:type II toxin-antitoxin system VapC family toxin [Candidatus Woesearchaeota archaeon]|nr:type II toxin-antitoxin system VapC family toxin [Candidatus Woesearchaeota archaeon]